MAGSSHEVRKTVTVLFCDVTESTELGGRLDPESLRRVMSRYFDEMRVALERHGGSVEKFVGDAVMAVFGVPVVHEDDALRAARAAVEMRERLAVLNDELERDRGVRLQARIALNSGEVIAGDPGTGSTFVTGDAVNVAKRLEQAAEPGEILVGELTHELLGDGAALEPLEPLAVKGKGRAVAAWRLLDVSPDAAPLPRRLETPLVGRAHELALLRHAYERAVGGPTCELLTVVGPAGIGKSRLAHELLDAARDEATVLKGRCLPYGDGITFWPLAHALREAGGVDAVETLVGSHPDAELIAGRVRGAIGAADGAAGEETFWAIRKLFEVLAERRPLVVCFEDIHWAEPTFLDLLEYVAAWSRGVPILLLCLTRPELVDRRPTWVAPRPNAGVVTLEPLSPAESETLLDVVAGGAEVDSATRARIAAAAEGNPLFVEQIAALLLEQDGGGDGGVAVPPSLQVLLASRLERLDAAERAVLERAAVAGREFWRSAVVELAPPTMRGEVGTQLMSLLRKGLIRPEAGRTRPEDDAFRFAHVLIRDAAYEGISKELRADLHERFADWMREAAGERATEVEEIEGYHLEQAYRYREQLGPVGPRERALAERAGDLLGSAGRRAFARDDMPAAIKLLDRAVSLLTDQHPARLELQRELSSAYWAVGEVARAEALLRGLLDVAAGGADRKVEWYALLDNAARRHITDQDPSGEELVRVAEQAIAVFEDLGDDLGLARAWRRLSSVAEPRCHFAVAQAAAERAVVHARRAGDRQEEARSLDRLCNCFIYGPVHAEEAIARSEEMLAAARGHLLMEANLVTALAVLKGMRGEFDVARRLADEGERIYDSLGLRLPIANSAEVVGILELLAGNAEAAERAFRRAHEIVSALAAPSLLSFYLSLLVETLVIQGRVAEAEEAARVGNETAAAEDVVSQIYCKRARACVEIARGRGDAAVAVASEAAALASGTDALNLHGDAMMRLGEALRVAGREEEAVAALREACDLYDRKGNLVSQAAAAALLDGTEPALRARLGSR